MILNQLENQLFAALITGKNIPRADDKTAIDSLYIWVFVLIGGLSMLFLVIGGTRYIFSGGEASAVEKAKNEIKYSIIGLLVAAFAGAAVNMVVNRL